MLNYNHLYYFHVAATEGSLAGAAAKLGVRQSTLSEQLRALERALNTTLFERSPSGMRLTATGQTAYEHTTAMFRAGDRLEQALVEDDGATPRTFRVGASDIVARASSTDFLLPLFALDNCLPTISSAPATDLVRELRANELDLVLCESEPPDAGTGGIEHKVIDQVPLVAITRAGADPGTGWQNIGLIQYRVSSALHWEVQSYLEAHGLKPRVVGEADDPSLLVEAAVRGGYLAIVPQSAARDALLAGRVRVLAQIDSAVAAVHALYQNGSGAQLARRAIEVLISAARGRAQ
jgi:LysR family transcriptional activator of nhaA